MPTKRKRFVKKITNRSTRSRRPSSIPSNVRFEWVAVNGYPYRPALIHLKKQDDGASCEMAQLVTAGGELCQKLYEFKYVSKPTEKPIAYIYALSKFNVNYRTTFV